MTKLAVINNGVVENIIEAPVDFELPGKLLIETTEDAQIGGTYSDGVFTPPEIEEVIVIPDRVTANQFGKQLALMGLLETVETWVDQQDASTQWSFHRSATFVRTDEMMQSGFAALGFSPEQIDAFFLAASTL